MRKNTRIFFIVIELCLHYCVSKNIQILYRQLDFFGVSDKESDINYGCLTHNIINFGKGDFYKLLFKRFMNLSLRRFLYFLKEHSRLCD